MHPEVLEAYIRQYVESQKAPEIQFAWQGGEPMLMGIDFFKLVLALQQKHAHGKKISNTIQTNGTLLTDDWCSFLKDNDFLVGVSIDGPQKLHNTYRVKTDGRPTFDSVMDGVKKLKRHKVPFNTLTVINDLNSRYPLKMYQFLKDIGDGHMQFIPAVERIPGAASKTLGLDLAIPPVPGQSGEDLQITPWSVSAKRLATFYTGIFDQWVHNDVGTTFVQFFDVTLGNWLGAGSGLCHFSPQCGLAGALEHNGDIYSCDHYVYPHHKLGNIMETPLSELMLSGQQLQFGEVKLTGLTTYCRQCEVRFACHGDCPKHRFARTPAGESGLSYLCPAYKQIFAYMAPYMKIMAQLVRSGQPVPKIMKILKDRKTSNHIN